MKKKKNYNIFSELFRNFGLSTTAVNTFYQLIFMNTNKVTQCHINFNTLHWDCQQLNSEAL